MLQFAVRSECRSISRVLHPRRLWSSLLDNPADRKLFLNKRTGVPATIINGNAISKYIRSRLSKEVQQLTSTYGRPPSLAVILVGNDPASRTYVGAKGKAAKRVGIENRAFQLPSTVSQEDLLLKIDELNQDDTVDGLIVQLPVPAHISTNAVCNQVKPSKDVDGYTIVNLGRLHVNAPMYVPATARGIRDMVKMCGFETEGKNVCVVGSSRNVGSPIARIFTEGGFNATVTVCHKYTPREDLAKFAKLADILVVCTGKPCLITAEMVKPGAVVVDVGINEIVDDDGKLVLGDDGKPRLVGDVEFDGVSQVVSAITPVPGGVGPLTVIGLMMNTVDAYKRHVAKIPADVQHDVLMTADI